jgi:hypothetical protein
METSMLKNGTGWIIGLLASLPPSRLRRYGAQALSGAGAGKD